jgi:excinuclease ABC subunit C
MIKLIRLKTQPHDKNLYFGPYTNASAARSIKDLLLKIFPLRQCADKELQNRSRACILYDIKKCLAPCINKCSKEEYDFLVDKVILFLKGKDTFILKDLQKKMKISSDNLEYEKANDYLNLINQIKHMMEHQFVDILSTKNTDVIGFYRYDFHVLIVKLIFQNGRLTTSEHFSFFEIASTDEEIIESFLLQHYQKHLPAKEIIIPLKLNNIKNIEDIISKNKVKTKILYPFKGKKKKLINLANENAKSLFHQEKDLKNLKEKQLLELYQTLELTNFPSSIVCFDISNISQTINVAAMVTFINATRDKSLTKLFKIKTPQKGDVPALKEALFRHFSKIKTLPDLLIVDGAKAQLNAAKEIFNQLKIASVDILAITKEMAKHTKGLTQEKIYSPYKKEPIIIERKSPILFLLQKIRDEAHRAAISFHKKKRSKKIITTKLSEIPGIGPKKTKELLKHFKSIANLKKAKKEDLQNLKILTAKDIETLFKFLKEKK